MLLAPTSADVTRGSRSVHATAICASVWPRRRAISVSARTLPSVSSLIMSVVMKTPRLARDPSGTPCRYRSVSSPWASAENTMQPAPTSASASSSPFSIHRLNIEYDGCEISSGVPLSLIHISEPTRLGMISYAVFCLKKKKKTKQKKKKKKKTNNKYKTKKDKKKKN